MTDVASTLDPKFTGAQSQLDKARCHARLSERTVNDITPRDDHEAQLLSYAQSHLEQVHLNLIRLARHRRDA